MKYFRNLLLLLLLLINHLSYSQRQFPNLTSCLDYAFEHRGELQLAKLNQAQSLENIKIAQSALLPQVKAYSSFDDNVQLPVQLIPAEFVGGQQGEFAKIQFGTQYNFAAGIEASIPVWNPSLWNKLKKSHLTHEKNDLQYEITKLQLAEVIAQQYYLTLLMQEVESIRKANHQNNEKLHQTAQIQFEEGTIELLEFNRIKSLWLQGKQNWELAKLNLEKQQHTLKLALGIPQEESLDLPNLQTLYQNDKKTELPAFSIESYPQYKGFGIDQKLADLDLKTQRQSRLPNISAYARYSTQAQRNEFNFFDTNQPWFGIGVIGMRVDIPIFTGFQRKSSIQLASIQRQVVDKQLDLFNQQQQQKDATLYSDYKSSSIQITYAKESFDLSNKNYELAQFKYENGVFTVEQLISIHAEQLNAQNQYLTQLGNHLIYKAILQVKHQLLSTENH